MRMANEVIEVVEEVKKVIEGHIYRKNKAEFEVFTFDICGHENDYCTIFSIKNDYGNALNLFIRDVLFDNGVDEPPKYSLMYECVETSEIYEAFFFETFSDLNHFLANNPFYNLIVKQFKA